MSVTDALSLIGSASAFIIIVAVVGTILLLWAKDDDLNV